MYQLGQNAGGRRLGITTDILPATAMAFGTGTLLFVNSFRNFGSGSFTSPISSEIMCGSQKLKPLFASYPRYKQPN